MSLLWRLGARETSRDYSMYLLIVLCIPPVLKPAIPGPKVYRQLSCVRHVAYYSISSGTNASSQAVSPICRVAWFPEIIRRFVHEYTRYSRMRICNVDDER